MSDFASQVLEAAAASPQSKAPSRPKTFADEVLEATADRAPLSDKIQQAGGEFLRQGAGVVASLGRLQGRANRAVGGMVSPVVGEALAFQPEQAAALVEQAGSVIPPVPGQEDKFYSKVAGGVGSSLAFAPAAVAGPLGVGLMGAAVGAETGLENAEAAGASKSDTVYAALGEALLGATEMFGAGKALTRFGLKPGTLAHDLLKETVEEFVQETGQNIGSDVLAGATYDPQRKVDLGAALESGLAAATGAAGISFGVSVENHAAFVRAVEKLRAASTPGGIDLTGTGKPMAEQEAALQSNTRQATSNQPDEGLAAISARTGEPVEAVPDQTGYEWEAERAAQAGTPLVLFRGTKRTTGAYQGGKLYLNADLPEGSRRRAVTYHELTHVLAERLPATWEGVRSEIPEALLTDMERRYREEHGGEIPDSLGREEGLARLAESIPGFLRAADEHPELLRDPDRSFLRRVLDWIVTKLGGASSTTKRLRALAETDFEKTADPLVLRDVARSIAKGLDELSSTEPGGETAPIQPIEPGAAPAEPNPRGAPLPQADEAAAPVSLPDSDFEPAPEPTTKELLANSAVRAEIEGMASEVGYEGVGGQIIREEGETGIARGKVIGRTRRVAKAEWWDRRPADFTEAAVRRAARRALAGNKLTPIESRIVDWMSREAAHHLSPEDFNADDAAKEREAIQGESKARNRKVAGVPFAVAPRRIIGYDLTGEPVFEEKAKEEKPARPASKETQGGLFTPKQSQAFGLGDTEVEKPRGKFAVAPSGSFDLPDDSRWRKFQRTWVNSFESIGATERKAPAKVGATEATKLLPGKKYDKAEQVRERFSEPIKALGLDVEKAGQFLYALHAPDRNAIIAARHPRKFGNVARPGSGMATPTAQKFVADALASPDGAKYRQLQRLNRAHNKFRLDTMEDAGLLSADQRAEWEKFGPDYVPLRTDTDPATSIGGGSGALNVRGNESKRAEGRLSIADNPLVFSFARTDEAIDRAERNKVGASWADLAAKNPGPEWRVSDTNDAKNDEKALAFKENGEQRYLITTNGPLANAFAQLDRAQAGDVLKFARKLSTYLHAVIINYNPVFAIGNMAKDVGLAAAKLSISDGPGMAAEVAKNAIPAARGVWAALRGEPGGKWGALFREMRAEGGVIGWTTAGTFEDRLKSWQKDGKMRAFANVIDDFNKAVESGTRLAVYAAAKKRGRTKKEAAILSRDITADFGQRGNWSSNASLLYMFFNANVQGTAGVAKSLADHPLAAARVAGSLVALGFVTSALSRMAGGDDDKTGEANWDLIPSWDKTRRIGVMVDGKFYGVPAPWGFNIFTHAGQVLEQSIYGRDAHPAAAMMQAAVEAFSPMQGANLIQAGTPTFARPFVEISQNRDFTGRRIKPDPNPYDKSPEPEHMRKFKSVSPAADRAATVLSEATGGNEARPGTIEVSPEDIEHVTKFATGGLGSNVGRVVSQAQKWIAGEPMRASDWPVVRTFMSEVPEGAVQDRYYEILTRIGYAQDEMKATGKTGDPDALKLVPMMKRVERQVSALRKAGDVAKMRDVMGQLVRAEK